MIMISNIYKALGATFFFLLFVNGAYSISIDEKKAHFLANCDEDRRDEGSLDSLNQKIGQKRSELLDHYTEANAIYEEKHPDYETLIQLKGKAIRQTRRELIALEQEWKQAAKNKRAGEEEALWHQPDTTIGQLVLDYGGSDCIYLIPPEIGGLRLHISSELSIPRSSWNKILELILASYGVGVKELNPFLKQLYFLKLNQSGISRIIDNREELEILPRSAKIAFVFSPQPHESKRVYQFLEKFIPHEQMNLQFLNGCIIATGNVQEIVELLKIYDFISTPKQATEWKLVALHRANSDEIAKILQSLFSADSNSSPMTMGQGNEMKIPYMSTQSDSGGTGLRVMALKHPSNSLFLTGKPDHIEKACEVIRDIENKIGQAQEKTIYWYACKHSDGVELAKVLSQVYTKLGQLHSHLQKSSPENQVNQSITIDEPTPPPLPDTPDNAPLIVSPQPLVVKDQTKKKADSIHENFIVDQKTNSIVMVVEAYLLPKLQELLKKLDVPKKMVQIDVLLFEKRINDSDQFGLNLLRLADAVVDPHSTKLFWNDTSDSKFDHKGILQFSITRGKSDWFPKYDVAYKFLLSQAGIHINANPSVTTVNQTPTKIALVDEISINTGVIEVDTTGSTRLKDSYTRAQYGIIIQVTPTIHAKSENEDDDDPVKFITLETDITFDTTKPSADNRPEVARRGLKNEVRIADGETLIVGGLRRKQSQNDRDFVPFLGEIPGLGKLFSTTALSDSSTEMFIFITPKIIPDPKEEFLLIRTQELKKRAGDIPEFLQAVETARANEKRSLFYHSLRVFTEDNS